MGLREGKAINLMLFIRSSLDVFCRTGTWNSVTCQHLVTINSCIK
jgi:hypothetical protein